MTKSYADKRYRELEFSEGDHIFLCVSPFKSIKRFGIRGNVAPTFNVPFQIFEQVGLVTYKLALLPSLVEVHNVFHVMML